MLFRQEAEEIYEQRRLEEAAAAAEAEAAEQAPQDQTGTSEDVTQVAAE